jgi:hypothetical protein
MILLFLHSNGLLLLQATYKPGNKCTLECFCNS